MDTETYRERLAAKERELVQQNERALRRAQEKDTDVGDRADASVEGEEQEMEFSEADRGSETLRQVRAALRRIDEGTFGQCAVDGGPIEEKRLRDIPWTPYCLKHQELKEQAVPPKTPTL